MGVTRIPQWLRQVLVLAGAWHIALGVTFIVAPFAFYDLSRLPRPNYPQLWQGVGILLSSMGIGYAIAARNPLRYWPVVLIGWIPKLLVPLGFLWYIARREIPVAFGSLVFIHDVVWLAPFSMLLWLAVRDKAAGEYPRSVFRGTMRDAMSNAITDSGVSLLELSESAPRLVVFLRHGGCIFCRETLGDLHKLRSAIEATGVKLAVVHMGMPDEGEELLARYQLQGVDAVSDPLRELYQAFNLKQGTFAQLFGPREVARGFIATLKGHVSGLFEGDALQLPGAFVVSRGQVLRSFRHRSAGDRPDYVALARGECDIPSSQARGNTAA